MLNYWAVSKAMIIWITKSFTLGKEDNTCFIDETDKKYNI